MLTNMEELNIADGLVEMKLEGGEFTDGDYRPSIIIRIPAGVDRNISVYELEKMILTWAQKEIAAQIDNRP